MKKTILKLFLITFLMFSVSFIFHYNTVKAIEKDASVNLYDSVDDEYELECIDPIMEGPNPSIIGVGESVLVDLGLVNKTTGKIIEVDKTKLSINVSNPKLVDENYKSIAEGCITVTYTYSNNESNYVFEDFKEIIGLNTQFPSGHVPVISNSIIEFETKQESEIVYVNLTLPGTFLESYPDGYNYDNYFIIQWDLEDSNIAKIEEVDKYRIKVTPKNAGKTNIKCTIKSADNEKTVYKTIKVNVKETEEPKKDEPKSEEPKKEEPKKEKTKKEESKELKFEDVKKTDWFYEAIKYAYENSFIKGYNDTTFAPNDNLTRGMLVTILYRIEGAKANDGKSKFADVDSKQWYAQPIKWAAENGVVAGYNATTFGPNDNITREQLSVILYRYAEFKNKDMTKTNDLKKFSDVGSISDYAVKAMKWAVGAGVITGNANGTLNPKGNATRAETAAMIVKYSTRVGL